MKRSYVKYNRRFIDHNWIIEDVYSYQNVFCYIDPNLLPDYVTWASLEQIKKFPL